MIAFILLFAAANAAPYYHDRQPLYVPDIHHGRLRHPYFGEDMFDTGKFWSELSSEMRQLDTMLADFYTRFPSSVTSEGIYGKEYKVDIPLNGFEEKDIVVKARAGMLMVQAVHKYEGNIQKSYLDVRTLPDCVNVNGTWTYDKGHLKIVFPLKAEATTQEPVAHEVTELPVTESNVEKTSREEVDNHVDNSNQDADVGVERGDTEKEQLSNSNDWRKNVEATTYAVDLKDEVEFVPIRY